MVRLSWEGRIGGASLPSYREKRHKRKGCETYPQAHPTVLFLCRKWYIINLSKQHIPNAHSRCVMWAIYQSLFKF